MVIFHGELLVITRWYIYIWVNYRHLETFIYLAFIQSQHFIDML